jgi:hypothetical protein
MHQSIHRRSSISSFNHSKGGISLYHNKTIKILTQAKNFDNFESLSQMILPVQFDPLVYYNTTLTVAENINILYNISHDEKLTNRHPAGCGNTAFTGGFPRDSALIFPAL